MDERHNEWYFSDMHMAMHPIPTWQLYGERIPFPDVLHIERIADRAGDLDWIIAPHRHLHLHQIFLLIGGQVSARVDDKALELTLPCLLNIPRGSVHSFHFSAEMSGYVLSLPIASFPNLFDAAEEASGPLDHIFITTPSAPLMAAFENLHEAHGHRNGWLRKTSLHAAATTILCETLQQQGSGTFSRLDEVDARFLAFQELVASTLRTRLSITAYASRLGMSSRHLNRLCIASAGLSAHRCIEEQILREACRLLAYTRMPVKEISYDLGFEDAAYFSRFFQRCAGMSPKTYRMTFEQPNISSIIMI